MFLAESSIQLVPDGTLLLHLLMVVVMVVVLNRTLLRPINRILEEREKHIAGRIDEARQMLQQREQTLGDYNLALREARSEGYQFIEKERAQAIKEKDEKVKVYRNETSSSVRAELQTMKDQEGKVRKELEGQAEELGSLISAHILRRR